MQKPQEEKYMIGITTTVPLEIPLAAGLQVVDLNNVFITHKTPLMIKLMALMALLS